jgi:hypothetical protein
MENSTMQGYSAFVYEVKDRYMAECSMLRIVSSGITPHEAVENLKQEIHNTFNNNDIQINPIFERR